MAIAGTHRVSLRQESGEWSRLTWALVISCAVHLLLFGGYWGGKKAGVWDKLHLPDWLAPAKKVVEVLQIKPPPVLQEEAPPELTFVDVAASQAVADPPKNPKFYSDRSSIAGNPNSDELNGMPKIDGKQDKIVKNASVAPEKFAPLQPSLPDPKLPLAKQNSAARPEVEPPKPKPAPVQPPAPKVAQEEPKPKSLPPGDLAMAKPAPPAPEQAKTEEPTPPRRPRTVEEALAQLGSDRLPGERMKQAGGVARQAIDPGFDVAASPFGAYDRALIQAISQRWYSLLDAREFVSDARGKVVVQFRLHYDGRITDVNISENSAGEVFGLICQRALTDPAPYPAWPSDMRRMLGDTRSIQFTFYYE